MLAQLWKEFFGNGSYIHVAEGGVGFEYSGKQIIKKCEMKSTLINDAVI